MTAQMSDVISCDFDEVDLDGLRLYRVICGDILSNHGWGDPYPFQRQPNPPKVPMCSALWRGFVSTYELRSDGDLYLVSYTYPFSKQQEEHFEEQLKGEFWLVMKPHFEAERVYIPFVRSTIVSDERQWVHEPPRQSLKEILENRVPGSD
jgi:hypothetical protein